MKALVLAVALLIAQPFAAMANDLVVQSDLENVVSSRLEGDWVLDESLGKRLLTGEDEGLLGLVQGVLSFQSQADVTAQLPDNLVEALAEMPIYMAGTMQVEETRVAGSEGLFLLTERDGNPHVVFLHQQNGALTGNVESANVMLVPASDASDDILFLGGDLSDQPFLPLKRQSATTN